ncbi:uncharacterized protein LOC103165267 [Ornithorhynchus anatinus]|uniref:uncharacterized protein LOC103165267 n=1 Tax=Ornithorhynchus anatinus TaxID=9258 RepID=UPI0019D44E09|nr:uncharacterized protein LOC103165267 [Ornithorhynchus anatinus]
MFLSGSMLWLLAYVSGASISQEAVPSQGELPFHWNSWQPWVCMCQLHKQARIRHFVITVQNMSLNLQAEEFRQEKPCSRRDCVMCSLEECPSSLSRSAVLPSLDLTLTQAPTSFLQSQDNDVASDSYDNLPEVDDRGED